MSMPVGYRFHPTDQELINYYLKLKNKGYDRQVSNIHEIDLCKFEPWELPAHLGSESDDQEWYFFSRRDSKYGKSSRSNRATKDGFWKPTGKDRFIKSSKKVIGTKKSLVFHRGRSQKAVRTNWVMHEFRASADKHNPQAFDLYLLKKKTEESVEVPNSDVAELNASSPFASMLNNVPSHTPSTPTVRQGSDNLTSSDHSRLTQNWKEQEVSSIGHSYPVNSAYLEDDDIDMQALENFFSGRQPTLEELDRILPAIPLPNVYPNQGPIHMTARYLNVSSNEPGVTQIQNIKRREVVNSINSATSHFMRTNESVTLDSESGTETDNDVPQYLIESHGGSAYHSDSDSSDQELYNDMILAHEVSQSGNSDITQHVELKAGKKEYRNLMPKKLAFKNLEAATDDSSVESPYEGESNHPEVGKNKSSGALGKKRDNSRFIVYAENPRVSNGKTPPSSYITNIAIGIFLTLVITGDVLFSLVC